VRQLILFPILGVTAVSLSAAALPAGGVAVKTVKVQQQWKGGSPDGRDSHRWRAAPPGGVIAGPRAWADLWKAWHPFRIGEAPPAVDFAKELILVAAGPGPNIIHIENLTLNAQGDLRFRWSITERGGPGFVYTIVKVNRAGIRTVNGNALPGDRPGRTPWDDLRKALEEKQVAFRQEKAGGAPADYLTADGRLKERLEVSQVQGGVVGFTGSYWVIEPDGTWSTGRIDPRAEAAPTAKGKLTPAQLAALAKALARHNLASLESLGRPIVNGRILTIRFGKRSVPLYATEPDRLIRERFEGIADAVRALCQPDRGSSVLPD
jgi:hypothetical protein